MAHPHPVRFVWSRPVHGNNSRSGSYNALSVKSSPAFSFTGGCVARLSDKARFLSRRWGKMQEEIHARFARELISAAAAGTRHGQREKNRRVSFLENNALRANPSPGEGENNHSVMYRARAENQRDGLLSSSLRSRKTEKVVYLPKSRVTAPAGRAMSTNHAERRHAHGDANPEKTIR